MPIVSGLYAQYKELIMPIVINKESETSIWLIIKSRLLCYVE